MANNSIIVHNLYAEATLPDAAPVNPPMILDGSSVSEIDVPSGTFTITDLLIGLGFVYWTIEVDFGLGGGFVTLATFGFTLVAPPVTEKKFLKSPIVIKGGAGVKVRLKVAAAVVPATPIPVDITLRCYTMDMVSTPVSGSFTTRTPTVITLTDLATTGATEQVLNMSENGGAPALSIPVPAASFLQIEDFDVAAGGADGFFKLQQTNDGTTWFTIGRLDVGGVGTATSLIASPQTSWKISGDDGPAVAARLAITTPGGAIPVAGVLSGARVS